MAQALLTVPQRQTKAFYDKAAARYAKYAAQFDMDGTLGSFLSTIEHEHVVLDIGCGSGRDLATLRGIADVAFGVDLSLELLKETKRSCNAPVAMADASWLPIADGRIDRVMAVASLHHLPRKAQVEALREIRRVLRPDGRAVVTIKLGRGALRDNDAETGEARVFHLTSSKRFRRRARRSGLDVMSAEESTSLRHGRAQVWLVAQLRVATRPSGAPPSRRLRAALRRRS